MSTHSDKPDICLECRVNALFERLNLPIPEYDPELDFDPGMEDKLDLMEEIIEEVLKGSGVPFKADVETCFGCRVAAVEDALTAADTWVELAILDDKTWTELNVMVEARLAALPRNAYHFSWTLFADHPLNGFVHENGRLNVSRIVETMGVTLENLESWSVEATRLQAEADAAYEAGDLRRRADLIDTMMISLNARDMFLTAIGALIVEGTGINMGDFDSLERRACARWSWEQALKEAEGELEAEGAASAD